jgi:hypothetical protein
MHVDFHSALHGAPRVHVQHDRTEHQNVCYYNHCVLCTRSIADGANGTEKLRFDWNKTTLVGMYDGGAPYDYGELHCLAHSNGTRIIDWYDFY